MKARRTNSRSGYSLVETMIAVGLFGALSLVAVQASNAGAGAYESARMNSSAEARLQRTMDRIVRELMPAGLSQVGPANLDDEFGSSTLTFQQAEDYVAGAIAWGPVCTLALELDGGELDDGIDNNGDGVIDEHILVFTRDDGAGNDLRTVLCRNVREFFEGEEDNNADDNGNLIEDEQGFNVHQDGEVLTIRLCVEEGGEQANNVVRSLTTSVRLRN